MKSPCAFFLLLTTVLATPSSLAASLSVSVSNASQCGVNYGGGFGSYQPYSVCQGSGLFGWGVMYNDTVSTISNNGSQSLLAIDGGVMADTTARPARFELIQLMHWNINLDIQAAASEQWHMRMDQSAAGLFALIEEKAGDGNGSLHARHDINQDINMQLAGIKYNIDLNRTSLNTATTQSAEFHGARSDTISGVGPAILSGFVRTTFSTYSACLSINPTCANGPEAAILFGMDNIGDTLAVTADDYATWGRSTSGDGYNASFALVPVPPAIWLFAAGTGLLSTASRRSKV